MKKLLCGCAPVCFALLFLAVLLTGCSGSSWPAVPTAPGAGASASPAGSATVGSSPVAGPVLTGLLITPGTLMMVEGESTQLAARGTFSDGSTRVVTDEVRWSSTSVAATVDASGQLQASAPTAATITAGEGQVSATLHVEVGPASPTAAAFATSVVPLPGEDLAGPCSYELLLPDAQHRVRGAWILFERVDTLTLWQNSDLRSLATQLGLALVYAHQCDAASYGDLQSDGRKGPARALATALSQFASLSGHPELSSTNLVLFGFSAAGVLSVTTAEALPQRVLTVITYAAGSAPLELRQLTPTSSLEATPVLMLANADDNMAGTSMGLHFFETGRAAGAAWAFAVEPNVAHCCTSNVVPMLLSWVAAVVPLRSDASVEMPLALDPTTGAAGPFTCTPDGVTDGRGYTDCAFSAASAPGGSIAGGTSTSWLPNDSVASAWLQWVGMSR